MARSIHLRIVCLLVLLGGMTAAEYVIAHDPGHAISVGGNDIRAMLVGRRMAWPDGRSVMVAAATAGPGHDGLMRFLGKSSQQFLNGWKKLLFTGNGSMPKLLAGDQEVAAYVAQTPGAIGFISGTPPPGVVVLLEVDATTAE